MAFESGHALVIGIGSYVNMPWADIPISVEDAEAVEKTLRNEDLCGYIPDQVTLLHDESATKDGILQALDDLQNCEPQDTVTLYYCGHGDYATDGDYYLTTHETELSGSKIKTGTGISETELFAKLREIPAERLLLLFNACHSGEISPSLGLERATSFGAVSLPEKSVDALLSTGEGRVIITASRPEQKSWIGSGQISIFTQALVDGLSGKGYVSNSNGYISAYSLYEHVYFEVTEAAEDMGKTQEPELTILRGVGPFPVALYRGATARGAFDLDTALPEDVPVREVNPKKSQRLAKQVIKNITASGKGAIAAETIKDSTIITGDHNVVQSGKYNVKIDQAKGMAIGDGARVYTDSSEDD